MGLFSQAIEQPENILSKDGTAKYYGTIISPVDADDHYTRLLQNIQWRNDEAIIFGKHITTKREVAWYADSDFEYTYSKTTKRALPWTSDLLSLKSFIEGKLGEKFNSCLLNLYHNGNEGMSWHSDAEIDLKKNGCIASLSFGAERKFCFRHKATKETLSLVLEHGSLLEMKGVTQGFWQHCLPITAKVGQPRINLTFRTINQMKGLGAD